MSLFRTGFTSSAEQLWQLREQAGIVVKDRVEPVLSNAAKAIAQPFKRVQGLLLLMAEYGGVVGQVLRWAKGQAEETVAPVGRKVAARRWSCQRRLPATSYMPHLSWDATRPIELLRRRSHRS